MSKIIIGRRVINEVSVLLRVAVKIHSKNKIKDEVDFRNMQKKKS